MIAFDLEFGPNTAEAHKKIIYGLFAPRELLSAYRTARSEHKSPDLVLVCLNMNPSELYAGPRVSMSSHLTQNLKFPAPLMSAHSYLKLPKDEEAFWLFVPVPGSDIPIMVAMFALKYEQVAEGQALVGEN